MCAGRSSVKIKSSNYLGGSCSLKLNAQQNTPERIFVGIGSNLGNRWENIKRSLCLLRQNKKIKIKRVSSVIESAPQGGPKNQPPYLNCVVEISSDYSPVSLLKALKKIEKKMGRVKTVRFGPRIIDLDILIYGKKRINTPRLIIPHPRMRERNFVMEPLREIAQEIFKELF